MFDLAEMLKGVSNPDTAAREQIEYLPIGDLTSDAKNFYTLSNLNDLADNISTIGLQQPLRVRPCTGRNGEPKYRIVSGHRRFNALKLLHAEEPARGWDSVPCIVEDDEVSEAMQELRLIYANSGTRRMSAFEIERQAERVKDLLYQLRAEGMEFPGRMRDHVAQACQISATKLARLEAIRNHLSEDVYEEFWRPGRITETAAYELSQYEPELQEKTMDSLWEKACQKGEPRRFTEADIKAEANKIIKKQQQPINDAFKELDKIMAESDNRQKEDVSNPDTMDNQAIPKPKWFTGIPSQPGSYWCNVKQQSGLTNRHRLDWDGDSWLIHSTACAIARGSVVLGWWPLPK